MNKVISIDYDGVIHDQATIEKGKKMGRPIDGAKEALKTLRRKGYRLIIFTIRGDHKYVREWLKFFEIPFDEITDKKPDAAIYIDDKALRFTDWPTTLAVIQLMQ